MIAPHLDSNFCLECLFDNKIKELVQFPVFTSKSDFINYLSNNGWKFEILVPDLNVFVDLLLNKNEWVHGGYGVDFGNNNEIYFRLIKSDKEIYAITEF